MLKLASLSIFCFLSAALADSLTLKSGRVVEGTYLGGTAREIRMEVGDRIETFGVDQVSGLQFQAARSGQGNSFDNGAQSAPPPAPPPQAPPPFSSQTQGNVFQPEPNNGGVPVPSGNFSSGIEIPAGTPITVRMIDSVDSDRSRMGESFRASVDEPVVVNGNPVIPRGADVVAKLVNDQRSGKIQGRTVLTLALVSIRANDRMLDITTGDVAQASSSRGARSAKVVGGTTALGAIIGGIAGGGRGAAIGAGSGAAVGTGAEMSTAGQRVRIPSETRLTFTLSNPVRF